MRIAVDAMGGDHAPEQIILGALQAAEVMSDPICLVGRPEVISKFLPKPSPTNIEIVPASEEVDMGETPTEAYRKKKDSSMMVCTRLVQEGRADAFVSAGNTGAAAAFSLLTWRQIPGIRRPAIASFMPNRDDGFLLLDAGASPDIDPESLIEFAVMGRAYAKLLLGREHPKVHIVNIGEEEGKGNAFTKKGYDLLKRYSWFAGSIEGKALYSGTCDVVVCDAFVGNVILKTSEAVAELIVGMIRESVPKSGLKQLAYLPMKAAMKPLRDKLDYANYGGSPLLGVNGVCVICHGRSGAKAIKNAILQAKRMAEGHLVDVIKAGLQPDSGS